MTFLHFVCANCSRECACGINSSRGDKRYESDKSKCTDFERVFIVDRPTTSEAVQAAIFVLETQMTRSLALEVMEIAEFVPKFRHDDLLLSDQSFGNDAIVDLARRDPEFSKTDDAIFLKGVASIDELVMTRICWEKVIILKFKRVI